MSTKALYGLFGGTFNPIHNGHLGALDSLCKHVDLSGVSLIPSALPPHKDIPCVSAEQRLAMARLAVAGKPKIRVDDFEITQGQTSYSWYTVNYFHAIYPNYRLCWILGMDALLNFTSWYKWQQILSVCHLIVLRRPGFTLPKNPPSWWQPVYHAQALKHYTAGRILFVDSAEITISSSQIRENLKMGEPINTFVPQGVLNYIQQNHLYHYDC